MDKMGFSGKDQTNKICSINVAPATNSVLLCANFNDPIYTDQLISGHC
jgi:hypothetical protein